MWYSFHNSDSIFVVAFSSLLGMVALFGLLFGCSSTLVVREQTLILGFAARFCFVKKDTREDVNMHMAIACKYLSNNIFTVVEECHQGYFSLTHSSLDMLLSGVIDGSQSMAGFGVGFCA